MKKDFKIILVEKNKFHAILMERNLTDYYKKSQVDVFSSGSAVLEAAVNKEYDVAIIQYGLSDMDGIQLLQLLRQNDIDIPVIITASKESEYTATEALNSGASDFIVKEGNYHQSLSRIVGEVFRRRVLILNNREMEERLRETQQKDIMNIAAGTLAHEINNPLMMIQGTVELLLQSKLFDNNEVTKKLKIIRKSAERIKKSLNRLSNISHPSLIDTITGTLVDPKKSRIYTKSKDKSLV